MKSTNLVLVLFGLIILGGCSNYTSDRTPQPLPPNAGPNTGPNNPVGLGPAPVDLSSLGGNFDVNDLGACGNYVILGKAGVTNVTGSMVTGNMGVSPAAASYITGFSLSMDPSNAFSTSPSVVGKVYAADYAPPTPANLTSAIGCQERAYNDAKDRTNPDFTELMSGNIGSLTLVPGLYKWSTNIVIPNDVTLTGGANDVWIFQISGDVSLSAAKQIILGGQAQAKNIFWQVTGQVTMQANSHFEGIILTKTAVTMQTNATMNGRIFAQTLVSLDDNAVTQP